MQSITMPQGLQWFKAPDGQMPASGETGFCLQLQLLLRLLQDHLLPIDTPVYNEDPFQPNT